MARRTGCGTGMPFTNISPSSLPPESTCPPYVVKELKKKRVALKIFVRNIVLGSLTRLNCVASIIF
jgi:hypothetical protein